MIRTNNWRPICYLTDWQMETLRWNSHNNKEDSKEVITTNKEETKVEIKVVARKKMTMTTYLTDVLMQESKINKKDDIISSFNLTNYFIFLSLVNIFSK